ncbi:hypothetical protein, partial [[Kitasatospora] papulosa]
MRVRIALSVYTAITVAGLGLSVVSPAIAASASTSQRVTAVQAAESLDVHREKFMTLNGCQTAGQQGIDRGHWDRYQ